MQEVINAVRAIGEIQRATADANTRTLTVTAPAERIEFTTWLFTELDKPASAPQSLTVRDSSIADPRAPAVKIFYLAHINAPQSVQELVNGVRSIADLQRVVAVSGIGAVIARGSSDQVALAEWLVRDADQPPSAGGRPVVEYDFPDSLIPAERRTPAVRTYHPARIATPLEFQEAVHTIRSIAEVQRVVVLTAPRAIVVRRAPEQVALSDWLVRELDQGPVAPALHEYQPGGT